MQQGHSTGMGVFVQHAVLPVSACKQRGRALRKHRAKAQICGPPANAPKHAFGRT